MKSTDCPACQSASDHVAAAERLIAEEEAASKSLEAHNKVLGINPFTAKIEQLKGSLSGQLRK